MSIPIYLVDAFTQRPFAGNPAAVCLLKAPAEPVWMQQVAAEMNQAETAFVVPEGPGQYGLRWYTPTVEVNLCGHATLASAHVLWTQALESASAIRFQTLSGTLTANRTDQGIALDFPADPPGPGEDLPALQQALGVKVEAVHRGREDLLAVVESAHSLCVMEPDLARIKDLTKRGCIVTAASDDPGIDFVSRFFAPAVGIDEDPVTGAAHCVLACYWGERLGRRSMTGYQASKRGGRVGVERTADRVRLSGSAVIVTRGELLP